MQKPTGTPTTTQARFLRFLAVGGSTAAFQMAVLWLAKFLFSAAVAFSVSFVGAIGVHYSLNRFWALPSDRRDHRRQLGEYLLTVFVSYLINLAVFSACNRWLGLRVMISALVAIPPSTVVVFLLLNYRIFRAQRSPSS